MDSFSFSRRVAKPALFASDGFSVRYVRDSLVHASCGDRHFPRRMPAGMIADGFWLRTRQLTEHTISHCWLWGLLARYESNQEAAEIIAARAARRRRVRDRRANQAVHSDADDPLLSEVRVQDAHGRGTIRFRRGFDTRWGEDEQGFRRDA